MALMNEIVRQRLLQINQEFYNRFADAFAATRFGAQPGWERIIPYFRERCQVLDLGCGNGRFAHFLDGRVESAAYTGLDGSSQLIKIAQTGVSGLTRTVARFQTLDLAQPDWPVPDLWGRFDVVIALAVLHHIPGFDARAAFLRAAARCLTPTGTLILSNWRFTHNQRMRRKIMPWAAVGLTAADLEAGDTLLDWKAGGQTGYRYAHQLHEAEMVELAKLAGFSVVEQFQADGREGDLSLYSVLAPLVR